MVGLGFSYPTPRMIENQMDKKMENGNDMEAGTR